MTVRRKKLGGNADINSERQLDVSPAFRRTTRKARGTRLAILAAAARHFAEQGFTDASLRTIAASAQMKAGSVYYHFSSKDEILDEILDTGIKRLQHNVEGALATVGSNAGTWHRLCAALRAHVESLLDTRNDANAFLRVYEHLPRIMKRRDTTSQYRSWRLSRRSYWALWSNLLKEGQDAGEIDPALNVTIFGSFLIQGLNRVPEWYRPETMTVDQVCQVVLSTTVRSILVYPADTHLQGVGERVQKVPD